MSDKYQKVFGETRCGEILWKKVKDIPKIHRKLASFYHETEKTVKQILFGIPDENLRKKCYIHYMTLRRHQLDSDLVLNIEDEVDIRKRMRYLVGNIKNEIK